MSEKNELVPVIILPGSEIIPPNGKRNMDAIKTKAETAFLAIKEIILNKCKIVESVTIKDASSCNTALQLTIDLNTALKTIEAKRKELKQPSIDEGKLIDEIAKILTIPANNSIATAKSKIKTYDDTLVAKEKEVAKTEEGSLDTIVLSESTVSKRKGWEFEIINQCAIPKEWLMLDEKKVREWLKNREKTTTDGEIVNGVKFTETSSVILK